MPAKKTKTDPDQAVPQEEVQAVADQAAEDVAALAAEHDVEETVTVEVTEDAPAADDTTVSTTQRVLDEAHIGTAAQPDPEPVPGGVDSDLSDPILRDIHGR